MFAESETCSYKSKDFVKPGPLLQREPCLDIDEQMSSDALRPSTGLGVISVTCRVHSWLEKLKKVRSS